MSRDPSQPRPRYPFYSIQIPILSPSPTRRRQKRQGFHSPRKVDLVYGHLFQLDNTVPMASHRHHSCDRAEEERQDILGELQGRDAVKEGCGLFVRKRREGVATWWYGEG